MMDKASIWKRLKVAIRIRNRIIGGIPNNKALIEGWLTKNMPQLKEEERAKLVDKTLEELGVSVDETIESMKTTFKKDMPTGNIYLEGRCVKAMFKEAANVLRELLIKDEAKAIKAGVKQEKAEEKAKLKKAVDAVDASIADDEEEDLPVAKAKKGEEPKVKIPKSRFTNLKSRTAERLFVEQDKVFFYRDGKALTEPDGSEERAIHVMTPTGPRTALKNFDYVNAPEMRFTLRFLRDGIIDKELVEIFLEYAGWNGLGSDRSQSQGMFDVLSVNEL